MKLTIHINQQVLEHSKNCTPYGNPSETRVGQNCAIGKAIYDLFGDLSWVSSEEIEIFKDGVMFNERGLFTRKADWLIKLPFSARDFIGRFDELSPEQRVKMKPFDFEINIPNAVIRLISLEEIYKVLADSQTLSLVTS